MRVLIHVLAGLAACKPSGPGLAPAGPGQETAGLPLTAEARRFEAGSAIPENPNLIGYEVYESVSRRFAIATFRGKTAEEIERYPELTWLGRSYYNVDGNFVFDSDNEVFRYYWNPPKEIVDAWNERCPSSKFQEGIGFYGKGWYWGGVGSFGFHAFATDRKVPQSEMPDEEKARCLREEPKPEKNVGKTKKLPGDPPPPPPPMFCASTYSCINGMVCKKDSEDKRGVCVDPPKKSSGCGMDECAEGSGK